MPGEHFAHFGFGGIGHAVQKIGARHQDSGRAITALQGVMAAKCSLQVRQHAGSASKSFHRYELATVGGNSECQAGSLCNAVDDDRAGTANAMFAADVHAGCTEFVSKKIGQQGARLAITAALDTVELKRNLMPGMWKFFHRDVRRFNGLRLVPNQP